MQTRKENMKITLEDQKEQEWPSLHIFGLTFEVELSFQKVGGHQFAVFFVPGHQQKEKEKRKKLWYLYT